ncbi:MAG: hypothetical protein ACI9TV_002490 [Sulfurimonas sp.]|jgi:hypothetical protein|uniref:hypothetical protein n=1 Tax=Sulfurimonas sp. TaxID=2022749 RepID=UPI0039E38B78
MIDEKPIDKKAIRRLHKEITDNIKMILNEDILEDGEDILLQNSADQIGITKELLQEILQEKEDKEVQRTPLSKPFRGIDDLF